MSNGQEKIINLIRNKKVLYIATKNEDYIRLRQEMNLVKMHAMECSFITSSEKSYFKRLLHIYKMLFLEKCSKYDVIIIGFMAQMILPWWNFKFRNKEIIVDFFISISDTLVDDRKRVSKNSFIGEFVHWIDFRTLNSADSIICDTKAHGKYFSEEFGINQNKFNTVYLDADKTIYYPMTVSKPEKWKDKYLVLYFGSILPVQGVNIVLSAIEMLKDEKNIHFLLIGPLNEKYKKVESDTVTYINWLSQEELAKYIACSDLCLGGHFSNTVGKAERTIPGKVYIYKAMNKRIILGDSEANREIFKPDDKHIFVERGNVSELVDCIKRMKEQYGSIKNL